MPDQRGKLLVAVLGFILTVVPSAPSVSAASLTGDVFVTLQSGDVRRAADVDVLLVPATPEFEAEWERLQSEYEDRVAPLATEYDSLKMQADALRQQQTAMSGNPRAAIQIGNQIIGILNQQMDLGKTRWRPLQEEYTRRAMRLLAQRATARTPTDVNGRFETSASEGRYYIFCRYQLPRETLYWVLPTQLQDATSTKVSLSNRSALRSPLRGRTYTNF